MRGKELGGAERDEEEEETEGTCCASQAVGQTVCEAPGKAKEWRDGSEGAEAREDVERALRGMTVEKAWASKSSAEKVSLWKLWGLRGPDLPLGWKILGSTGG